MLLAGEQARASGASARLAVLLARRWPGPRRTVLVDLDVARPSLHQLTGVDNDESVIDVVELGASLHRIAVPVAGERFSVLPAGPVAPGGEEALRASDAWPRILQEAAGRRETLLLYVPAAAPVSAKLVDRIGAVLILAHEDEAKAIIEQLPRSYAVLAVLAPQAARAPSDIVTNPVTSATPPAVPARDGVRLPPVSSERRTALAAEVRRRQRGARLVRRPAAPIAASGVSPAEAVAESPASPAMVTAPTGVSAAAQEARLEVRADAIGLDVREPAPPVLRRRRRYMHPIGLTYIVVLLISLAAGSLEILTGRWGRPAAITAPDPEPVPVMPVTAPVAPAPPATDAVPFAVALEAHRDVATAFERADALTTAHKDLSFHVAPLEREGVLHYHLMAGPVADSVAALALRDTLIARRVKTRSSPSDIRYAPLALLIGDYSARPDAEQQLMELRRLDLPGYLVVGIAADSAPLYRVFVGGFAGPAEADVVRQLLRASGVRDNLVPRTRSSTR